MIPEQLRNWCVDNGYGAILDSKGLGGGCISDCLRVNTQSKQSLFLKVNRTVPDDFFAAEAQGLQSISASKTIAVPSVLTYGTNFIALEYMPTGAKQHNYWPNFGRQLAMLHMHHGPYFGFQCNTYCGSSLQPNPATTNGYEFFSEYRIRHQMKMATDNGYLDQRDTKAIDSLLNKLDSLIPAQPPSLIHGDLWSGNAHATTKGEPALIDPAAHWGWAEADLAMTRLFGGFPPDFYRQYVDCLPLEAGFEGRINLYNIYHLLNHLNIFGQGYLSQLRAAYQPYL